MWFKKDRAPKEPRERRPSKVPEGLWVKCENCRQILYNKELARNFKICPKCSYHFRLSAPERLRMLFDDEEYVELVVLPVIEQHPQPLGRREPEVKAALGADLEVPRELLVVEDLPAVVALDPETLRDLARSSVPGLLGGAVFLEPHRGEAW